MSYEDDFAKWWDVEKDRYEKIELLPGGKIPRRGTYLHLKDGDYILKVEEKCPKH